MKKRIIIIPIAIMSLLLGACGKKDVAPVYAESWLTDVKDNDEDPNSPSFYLVNEEGEIECSSHDYGLVLRDRLLNALKNVEPKKISKIDKNNRIGATYQVRKSINRLSYCTFNIFNSGKVETFAGGSGWGAPKEQFFSYEISASVAESLITGFANRYSEIEEILSSERAAAKENSTTDKFFENVEASEQGAYITYKETREDQESNTFTFQDDSRSFLDDFKDLEYVSLENYSISLVPMIRYYLTEDWQLEIFCGWGEANYDVAAIRYKDSKTAIKTYYPRYYSFYYSINATKGEALASKIRTRQTNGQ